VRVADRPLGPDQPSSYTYHLNQTGYGSHGKLAADQVMKEGQPPTMDKVLDFGNPSNSSTIVRADGPAMAFNTMKPTRKFGHACLELGLDVSICYPLLQSSIKHIQWSPLSTPQLSSSDSGSWRSDSSVSSRSKSLRSDRSGRQSNGRTRTPRTWAEIASQRLPTDADEAMEESSSVNDMTVGQSLDSTTVRSGSPERGVSEFVDLSSLPPDQLVNSHSPFDDVLLMGSIASANQDHSMLSMLPMDPMIYDFGSIPTGLKDPLDAFGHLGDFMQESQRPNQYMPTFGYSSVPLFKYVVIILLNDGCRNHHIPTSITSLH
jgi:hypothetical protein